MDSLLYSFANEYISFEIAGKIINVPYSITKEGMAQYAIGDDSSGGQTDKYANYGGKGTPEQIRNIVIQTAEKDKFDLQKAKPEEIIDFMIEHGIGVDCSGFVYNVLNLYLKKTKNKSLDTLILRYKGIAGILERFLLQYNRVRRSSAATLTNDLNTVKIEAIKDIRPGDMIRLTHTDWKGKHIAIIVDVDDNNITYAMSSQYTITQGVHFGEIQILDKTKGLEAQEWLEETKKGENYGKDAFDPYRGDSVRRLRFLSKI